MATTREIECYVTFGNYTIRTYDADSIWLENEAGEGMQVWNNDVAELLNEYFNENF